MRGIYLKKVNGYYLKSTRTKRDELIKDLPVREIPCDIPEEDMFCDQCGAVLKLIGYEKIREELEYIPAKLQIVQKKPQSRSYMWLHRTSSGSSHQVILYDYQPSRSGDNAVRYLKGFHGNLHTDGYSGYNKPEGITRCGC